VKNLGNRSECIPVTALTPLRGPQRWVDKLGEYVVKYKFSKVSNALKLSPLAGFTALVIRSVLDETS
jgi:hypothetical protein